MKRLQSCWWPKVAHFGPFLNLWISTFTINYIHFLWKKGILTLVIRSWSMRNTQDGYRQEVKTKLFSQCPSVGPSSVRRTDKNKCMRFFCLKVVYWESNFDPIAWRLTKLKPNEIFNDFAISTIHLESDRERLGRVIENRKLAFCPHIQSLCLQIAEKRYQDLTRINFKGSQLSPSTYYIHVV